MNWGLKVILVMIAIYIIAEIVMEKFDV